MHQATEQRENEDDIREMLETTLGSVGIFVANWCVAQD